MIKINAQWKSRVVEDLDAFDPRATDPAHVRRDVSFNKAAQWMILELLRRSIPYKVFNAGAGVKVITTDVDKCPLCKRKQ